MKEAVPAITPALLAGLVPLSSLRAEGLAHLASEAVWTRRDAGEWLFRVGEPVEHAHYLFHGEIELRNPRLPARRRITAGTEAARHRIPVPAIASFDAVCVNAVRCLSLDRKLIDMVLTWEQGAEPPPAAEGQIAAPADDDWMMRLLQTPAFQSVPPMHLQAMFLRMQTLDVEPGDVILRQGEPGDYFYVLTRGRCIVTRAQPSGKPLQLAQLEAGSCFGEEALISDTPRNATVTMLTRGSLRRLAKDDFRTLLHDPLIRRVGYEEASAWVAQGRAEFLDVRLPSEFAERRLQGSTNLPLYLLRMRSAQLDSRRTQVCVCDTERRSAVASFLLLHRGFDACVLAGGLPAEG